MSDPDSSRCVANDVLGQRGRESIRQHCDAVLVSLAVANQNEVPRKLDILNAQPDAFHDAHARSV